MPLCSRMEDKMAKLSAQKDRRASRPKPSPKHALDTPQRPTWSLITRTKKFAKEKQKKKLAKRLRQHDAESEERARDDPPHPSSAVDTKAERTGNDASPFSDLIADTEGSGVEYIESDGKTEADDGATSATPESEVLEAETRARTAEDIIKQGQQTRLRHIRQGHWDLYSHEFNQMCLGANVLRNHQRPGLLFQRGESHVDQCGKKQWRFYAGMVIGDITIQTDVMDIPKYPSSEPVTVLAEAEDGAVFDAKFTFLGVGCLKVVLPMRVIEHPLGIRSEKGHGDKTIEFIGVQSTPDQGGNV